MVSSASDFIPCVLIPLNQQYLLLPNASIAEVIPKPRFQHIENEVEYKIGQYVWQDTPIQVIDLDSLIEQKPSDTAEANKLCILRSINNTSSIHHYAVACYGAPQLIHLTEAALNVVDQPDQSNLVHCHIKIGTKIAYIPNLDAIEQEITL
jgi:chemosensory pili system protein ChpC